MFLSPDLAGEESPSKITQVVGIYFLVTELRAIVPYWLMVVGPSDLRGHLPFLEVIHVSCHMNINNMATSPSQQGKSVE